MKKLYLFKKIWYISFYCIIFYFFVFLQKTQGQTFNDTVCWVWVNGNEFMAADGKNFSTISKLDSLFSENNVDYYELALPFAKNPELLKIHEIRCNSNGHIDSVINMLNSNFPSHFDRSQNLK